MNLVGCVVTKVLSDPIQKYGNWWVKVEFDSYGVIKETEIMFKTYEECLYVQYGYVFLN